MIDNIFDLTKIFITLLREHTAYRRVLIIILPIIILGALGWLLFFPYQLKREVNTALKILIGISSFLLLIALASLTELKFDTDILTDRLSNIKEEREKLIDKIGNDSVVSTIQLSLNQLTEYYTINLSQAKNSYRWSIAAIVIGFLTLVAGAWLLFFQEKPNLTVGIITGISGILIEFIGASNIYIYNRSLSQLNMYFKQLINIQDTMLAIELCEKIDNANPKKVDITEKIIMNLIERNLSQANKV